MLVEEVYMNGKKYYIYKHYIVRNITALSLFDSEWDIFKIYIYLTFKLKIPNYLLKKSKGYPLVSYKQFINQSRYNESHTNNIYGWYWRFKRELKNL